MQHSKRAKHHYGHDFANSESIQSSRESPAYSALAPVRRRALRRCIANLIGIGVLVWNGLVFHDFVFGKGTAITRKTPNRDATGIDFRPVVDDAIRRPHAKRHNLQPLAAEAALESTISPACPWVRCATNQNG
jgi:hypothetical protein